MKDLRQEKIRGVRDRTKFLTSEHERVEASRRGEKQEMFEAGFLLEKEAGERVDQMTSHTYFSRDFFIF
jgi:hypothetical protein